MSRHAGPRHGPETLAARVRSAALPWPSLDWLNAKTVAGLIVALTLAFLGAISLMLRDIGSYARRKIDFPPVAQIDSAIAAAQERLNINSHDLVSKVELGTLYLEKGKESFPEGINELEEARDLGALDPRIFYCLGIMYQEVGLYDYALEEFRRFLRHYPDDKEIRLLEAKLLYRQGLYKEAVAEYERLKFHFPNDSLVEENLGLSLWAAKSTEQAIKSFNQLRSMDPVSARRAEFYLGQIAFEQGQFDQALDHFLRSQALGPIVGIPAAKLNSALAAAYQKLGRIDEARSSWQLVLQETPEDGQAKAALRDLNRRYPPRRKDIAKKS
ncbi:MAG: tetratricopeptide repeat protein [Elusimicrobia bacterium]|nr:tetratricopeptide repeat protein [Elusimicrobiota bacterium]